MSVLICMILFLILAIGCQPAAASGGSAEVHEHANYSQTFFDRRPAIASTGSLAVVGHANHSETSARPRQENVDSDLRPRRFWLALVQYLDLQGKKFSTWTWEYLEFHNFYRPPPDLTEYARHTIIAILQGLSRGLLELTEEQKESLRRIMSSTMGFPEFTFDAGAMRILFGFAVPRDKLQSMLGKEGEIDKGRQNIFGFATKEQENTHFRVRFQFHVANRCEGLTRGERVRFAFEVLPSWQTQDDHKGGVWYELWGMNLKDELHFHFSEERGRWYELWMTHFKDDLHLPYELWGIHLKDELHLPVEVTSATMRDTAASMPEEWHGLSEYSDEDRKRTPKVL